MAKPIFGTDIFGTDQVLEQTVTVYDTPHTIQSAGMIYRPASPTATFGSSIDLHSATLSNLNTHFDNNTTPGIVDDNGAEVQGRIPLIYDYWGPSAPLGVQTSGSSAIRVKGLVKNTGSYGLAVLGKGNCRIFKNGTEILDGSFDEENPLYTSSLESFTAGDTVEIFFWTLSQNWGGWAIRVFDDANIVSSDLDWDLLRETDILSASWMDDNTTVDSVELTDVSSVDVSYRLGQIASCDITIGAAAKDNIRGWELDTNNVKLTNVDTGEEISLGSLIKFSGGVEGDVSDQFTGHITEFIPKRQQIVIKCLALESRLASQLSENYPDRTSYAAFGYTETESIEHPVWNIPAYDHWPYEHAIKDMLYRAWIDPSLLSASKQVLRVGETTAEDGELLFKVRDFADNHIRIQRNANYGNPNAEPDRPIDDDYLTPSKLNDSLYKRVQNLTERIGYDFTTDPSGNFVVRPRNNPTSVVQVTGGTSTTNPGAIGGQYEEYTGTGWSYSSPAIKASRIELVVGRGSGLGTIDVDITRQEDSFSDSITIDTSNNEELFYYDKVLDVNLKNITVFTILEGEDYGTYDITITPNGGTAGTEYRLDALRVFEEDPITPNSVFSLSTLKNVLKPVGRSNQSEHINDAIVTGARKSAITDSDKAVERVTKEFVISRSTDLHSIFNPAAENYDGRKITAFLSDETIADQDLADWASQTLVSKFRVAKPDANIQHTLIPVIELRDPVYITDDNYKTFDSTKAYWITGYKHSFSPDSATTDLELTPFSETPSFEPREEIDISLYNNKPVINLTVEYPSLDGSSTITNPAGGQSVESTLEEVTGNLSDDGTLYLTIPDDTWSPGTELLRFTDLYETDDDEFEREYFKNNPYHKFYSKSGTKLYMDFEMADGTAAYDPSGWSVVSGQAAEFTYHKIQDVYSGTPPFYDPYYSELSVPELVEITFDALISGYYRVSIVDARDSTSPKTVAWLTSPSEEDPDGSKHWRYINSGPDKQFFWDGVDNIGLWNRRQYDDYSWRQGENFDTVENPAIGKGFYAGNDKTTKYTHISSELEGGDPVYPIGHYSQFYVKVEVVRETDSDPLIVESNNTEDLLDTSASSLPERYIYYHLPQPNKVSISIEDWDDSGGDFDPNSPGSSWSSTLLDNDASIRDGKPVRMTFTNQKRLGAKFTSDDTYTKLHRAVTLESLILDQFAMLEGEPWNSRTSNERKRVTSRRFNVDHSIVFKDSDFRNDHSEWIFYPSLFEKDFGDGKEPLEYLNYLQLTEVPGWNPQRRPGEERSRFQIALMAYLFYLSAYTQDRSGRLVWSVDTSFVDKSKILNNTDTTTWPSSTERHQRRTIYTRQWWDYDILNTELSQFTVPVQFYGGYCDSWSYHHTDNTEELYPTATNTYYTNNVETGTEDPYSRKVFDENLLTGITAGSLQRDLGTPDPSPTTSLGDWTWENVGFLWIPDITRDFHPFHIQPPQARASTRVFDNDEDIPWGSRFYVYSVTHRLKRGEGKLDNWFSFVHEYNTGTAQYFLTPARSIDTEFENKIVDDTLIHVQRQDDIKHYEDSRGGFSAGPAQNYDLLNIVGGNPYLLNTKLYRYYRRKMNRIIYHDDVWREGWFHLTFRHTYNWESPSLFPTGPAKELLPSAIDKDITGSPVVPSSFDPGAWAGWKDDHPGPTQDGLWNETGTCDNIHWRNDHYKNGSGSSIERHAGGSCEISDPTVSLSSEIFTAYTPDKNIFLEWYFRHNENRVFERSGELFKFTPLAVGPRLAETRRVLLATVLENTRRNTPI